MDCRTCWSSRWCRQTFLFSSFCFVVIADIAIVIGGVGVVIGLVETVDAAACSSQHLHLIAISHSYYVAISFA